MKPIQQNNFTNTFWALCLTACFGLSEQRNSFYKPHNPNISILYARRLQVSRSCMRQPHMAKKEQYVPHTIVVEVRKSSTVPMQGIQPTV